mmetsp:Transcript_17913/g.21963  ORF Transcript_17913/g.21963 Transcript_17913/m.21963 type:complete len:513 (+) Transcript_17913:38-1576(+)
MSKIVIASTLGAATACLATRLLWPKMSLRFRLRVMSRLFKKFTLSNVRIPVALLEKSYAVDEEGLVTCAVEISDNKVMSVKETWAENTSIECGGAILISAFCDAHTHLIKTQVVPRNRNDTGSVNGALAAELEDQPRWKEVGDVKRRMEFAVSCAYHHGTRALRTHLDGTASEDAQVASAVWLAFDETRDKWAQRGVQLQGVANLYLPLYLQNEISIPFCDEAARHKGVVLGAYCGNVSSTPHAETVKAMKACLEAARTHGQMDCDWHIDETNDPECRGMRAAAEAIGHARKVGYTGRVVLGHCCALALVDDASDVIKELAKLSDIFIVSNPTTNLGLQDRRGTGPPFGLAIDTCTPRTPAWRGMTLLQELRDAGIPVAAASDNVRDHWHPYGDYDMLTVWGLAQAICHLDTANSEGEWADLVSVVPAKAMGLDHYTLIGSDADLVLFPSARRASELFARPQIDRIVLRRGIPQVSILPQFSVLDDLVLLKNKKPTPGRPVQRGAATQKFAS